MKRCSKCNRRLPATDEHFHRVGGKRNDLRGDCKECVRERTRSEHRVPSRFRGATRLELVRLIEVLERRTGVVA